MSIKMALTTIAVFANIGFLIYFVVTIGGTNPSEAGDYFFIGLFISTFLLNIYLLANHEKEVVMTREIETGEKDNLISLWFAVRKKKLKDQLKESNNE